VATVALARIVSFICSRSCSCELSFALLKEGYQPTRRFHQGRSL
jgi:hypothetical protein